MESLSQASRMLLSTPRPECFQVSDSDVAIIQICICTMALPTSCSIDFLVLFAISNHTGSPLHLEKPCGGDPTRSNQHAAVHTKQSMRNVGQELLSDGHC